MNRSSAALFVFAFALGFCRGGVPDDANSPVIVNNKSSTIPPVTVVPEASTDSTTISSSSPTTSTTTKTSTTSITTSTSFTAKPIPPSPPAPTNTTTTVQPQTTTASLPTTAAPHKGNRFDGPSFIGGIILATGLMGIGFVAFKFYKARTERNYHTL